MNNKKITAVVISAMLSLTGLWLVLSSFVRIPAGYVGVVYNINGGIKDTLLSKGWKLKSPFEKVTKYPVSTEQAFMSKDKREGSKENESFTVPTSDAKKLNVDLEFSYHFDSKQLPKTFTMFRGQSSDTIESSFIKGHMKSWTAEATSKFSIMDMLGAKREQVNDSVRKHVNEKFKHYGIIIESVNFSRIDVDKETADVIQQRINAQQQLEKEKVEKDKAEISAQKKLIEAKADADAKMLKAKADAEANEKIKSSISDELIRYNEVLKWDGKKPQVVGGNSIVDVRGE